ncbi:Type IV fimbrial biogenesis protein PilY1 [Pseudoalteromonas luteoviolacea B = ATCC 29581]|nr:Type IV fimbrial biogenesis protein PilY1 [Pseudoalteromonas luteoviolacea B = ATCC 29581]
MLKKIMAVGLGVLASIAPARAEDIELYVTHNSTTKERPRVMVLFDTSGSMAWDVNDGSRCYERKKKNEYQSVDCFDSSLTNTKCYKYSSWYGYYEANCGPSRLSVAQSAMTKLIQENADIDFGLMRLYSDDGGYILNGLGASQSSLLSQISNLPASGSTPIAETLWEAYLYMTGKNVYYGAYHSNRDKSVENGNSYISPFSNTTLTRCDNSVNMILMTDGDPTGDSNQNYNIYYTHYDLFGTYPSPTSGSYLNSLAKILYGSSEQVVDLYPSTPNTKDFSRVYTIGFGTGMSNDGMKLLEKTAQDGGGQYLHANTAQELVSALEKQINNIREVNDSFSSPAVAVSSTDQTQSRDSLYFTMFYPETHARWRGNMKKLKVSGAKIVDQSGKQALNELGLIDKDATTYWSTPSSKDGNQVHQGGIAQVLANQTTRTVYSNYNGSSLKSFDYTTALNSYGSTTNLASAFNANAADVAKIINWAQGIDVNDEDGDNSVVDRRSDIFGDPLHSKPVTIDYGNNDVRVVVGTNAGFIHMFKDSDTSASETWAFIPGELLPIIKPTMLKEANKKYYGMDGPLSVHFDDKNRNGIVESGDSVILIAGMRRGGRSYYALDVTSPNQPVLKWVIKGGSGDFQELAQSWSKPLPTYIKKSGTTPVVIFAAGYDTNKDAVTKSVDTKGRGIYIVEALTGKLVWALTPASGFKGKHSMPADLSLLDSDYDGFTDRIYASDVGGGVWRIDLPGTNPNDSTTPWTHFQLASLAGSTSAEDRKFFYKPMIARTLFSKVTNKSVDGKVIKTRRDTPYEAILLGSGNRSHPNWTSTSDYLFVIRDENTITQSFTTNAPQTVVLSDLMDMNSDPFKQVLNNYEDFVEVEADLGGFKGWKYKLSTGEKSLAAPSVAGGIAYFTSFTPADLTSNQCSLSGGKGQLYAFHLHYGTQVYEQLKYDTSYDVPDTPKLYFGCEGGTETEACTNTVRMVGPAIKKVTNNDGSEKAGPQGGTPWAPVEVIPSTEPVFIDGKAKLVNDDVPIGFGLKTIQTFIYKKEEHDEKK